MDRRQALMIGLVALVVGACDNRRVRGGDAQAPTNGWQAPPYIAATRRDGATLAVSGRAQPGARVVLKDQDDGAFAASTDDAGNFEIRIGLADSPRLYGFESEAEGFTARGVGWLLVTPGAQGISAVLTPGAASRTLEGGSLVSAVDHDGEGALVSGHSAPGRQVKVSALGAAPVSTVADAQGRFEARLTALPAGESVIVVTSGLARAEVRVDLSPAAAPTLHVEETPSGVLVLWPLPGGGAQTTWIATDG